MSFNYYIIIDNILNQSTFCILFNTFENTSTSIFCPAEGELHDSKTVFVFAHPCTSSSGRVASMQPGLCNIVYRKKEGRGAGGRKGHSHLSASQICPATIFVRMTIPSQLKLLPQSSAWSPCIQSVLPCQSVSTPQPVGSLLRCDSEYITPLCQASTLSVSLRTNDEVLAWHTSAWGSTLPTWPAPCLATPFLASFSQIGRAHV